MAAAVSQKMTNTQGGNTCLEEHDQEPEIIRRKSTHHDLSGNSSMTQIYTSVFVLFVPTMVSRLAWMGMKTTDTALIGHSGTDFLTASSLSDFLTSISGALISDLVLGSLCGQAYGAKNYDLVGTWLQISWTVFSWIMCPVFVVWCATGPILRVALGTDPEIASAAGYYAIVLALCLPARLISGKLSTFFNSQKILAPSTQTTPLGLILNLAFGFQFVLGIPYKGLAFGFWACPIVTTCVEWFLVFVYIFYYCGICRYHEKCYTPKVQQWNFLKDIFVAPFRASRDPSRFAYYNENIRPRLREFIRLALPATLASASDFWRMSAIGLLSGTLGNKDVAVFNSSYRFAWMNMVVIGSFSGACATQLGIALGTGDGTLARKVRDLGIASVGVFLLITTGATMYFIEYLAVIFTSDPEVIALFVSVRWEMGFMIFFMSFSIHFEALLYALKKTDTVFKSALAGSWLGQVPAVIGLLVFSGKTLQNIYLGVGLGYLLLFVLYMLPMLQVDLDEAARKSADENQVKQELLVN